MLTITLTIDAETLDALQRGEAVTLKATGKRPRARKTAALAPDAREVYTALSALWAERQPEVPVARAMKAHAKLGYTPEMITALETALDWNAGRVYPPEWFQKDVGAWVERAAKFALDPFGYELDRTTYRARFGLA